MPTRYAVEIGLDVGQTGHDACAHDSDGNRLFDKPLPQDEAKLRELFTSLQDQGEVLTVIDQPNTIGTLPIAVTRDACCTIAYLPGLAMRKAADLHPDRSKTNARDAFIIAETARTLPHTLRQVDRDSEIPSALKVLAGFGEDLAHKTTRALNRIRSLLIQIHPAPERTFASGSLSPGIVLELLIKFGDLSGFKHTGIRKVLRFGRSHARRVPENLVDRIFTALGEQTVVVPATATAELVIPRLAGQLEEHKQQWASMAREVEALQEDFPLASVLMSMPGLAPRPQTRSS
ncbi:IS110 family transposase [Kocuria atrinae]|uniref:IS110 family transposase n=1 Tax=Kocuria atrinae TaxID=592377 RepID=UPI0002FFF116